MGRRERTLYVLIPLRNTKYQTWSTAFGPVAKPQKIPQQFLLGLGGGSIFFYFHPYLGKIQILTNIFQMGWNHHLVFLSFLIVSGISTSWCTWRQLPDDKLRKLDVDIMKLAFELKGCKGFTIFFIWRPPMANHLNMYIIIYISRITIYFKLTTIGWYPTATFTTTWHPGNFVLNAHLGGLNPTRMRRAIRGITGALEGMKQEASPPWN